MYYIGVDLAWSENNYSGVCLLRDNKLLYCDVIKDLDDIAEFINRHPEAKVGIDAPLLVENISGNRDVEVEFLKDYSKKKLGAYPVNRNLLSDKNGNIRGELLKNKITQKLGGDLFEVYPHATILECFHSSVLPYKKKKGRSIEFIKQQLMTLLHYLQSELEFGYELNINTLKGEKLKHFEDKLDAIVCAYTLYYCDRNPFKLYKDIFMVPKGVN